MKPSIHCLMLILAMAIVLPAANAGEKPAKGAEEKPSVEVVELTVHPASAPRAAFEYRLLPSYLNKTHGDAAPMYSKACLLLTQATPELWDKVHNWLKTPVDELPLDEVRDRVSKFDVVFRQLAVASQRTYCDWGLPIRETGNPYEILLPELQRSRNLARVAALRARLAIADGDMDKAVESLQVGFALARHVGEQSTIVGGLVGMAIASLMADQVETLIQLPDAPNLYWSLTALPSPVVDLTEAIEMESVAIYLLFPQFAEVKTKRYTPAQWEALFDEEETISKLEALVESIQRHSDNRKGQVREGYQRMLKEGLPMAKRDLAERGYSEEDLERMPASQVVVLHTSLTFDEFRDEMFKWFYVPYWQARGGMEAAVLHALGGASKQQGGASLAYVILPALGSCHLSQTRTERRFAALRVLEAIRLYAAVHDGKLPASLDEVEEPIPANPFTGEPFGYRLEGDTAVLEAAGPDISRPRQYRLKLAQ